MIEAADDRLLAEVGREAMLLFAADATLMLAPILVAALVFGLVQTIFSLQEASLTFLPKLAAFVGAAMLGGNAVMRHLSDLFSRGLIDMVGALQ